MERDEIITITDEDGKEQSFVILFTYNNPKRGTDYVFFYPEGNDEEVMFARYYDDHSLEYVEDEDEIAEIKEVFAAFEADLEDLD